MPLTLSTTDKIDGKPIYEAMQGIKSTYSPILDPNSGLNDKGDYEFSVIKTRKNKVYTYPFMTQSELNYMLSLVAEPNVNPKEFLFATDWGGKIITFNAYAGSNITFDTVIKGKLYANVTFNISETR